MCGKDTESLLIHFLLQYSGFYVRKGSLGWAQWHTSVMYLGDRNEVITMVHRLKTFARTQIWFSVFTSGSLQLPITPAPGESDTSGLLGHQCHMRIFSLTHTHTVKNKLNVLKKKKDRSIGYRIISNVSLGNLVKLFKIKLEECCGYSSVVEHLSNM